MRRLSVALVGASLLLQALAPAAHATVNVNRSGDENPMQEVAKSVLYGGLAGLTIGGALAWASDHNHNDADLVRYGTVTGTFLGLGVGLWWVTRRPSPTALITLGQGHLLAAVPVPELDARGRARLALARVRF